MSVNANSSASGQRTVSLPLAAFTVMAYFRVYNWSTSGQYNTQIQIVGSGVDEAYVLLDNTTSTVQWAVSNGVYNQGNISGTLGKPTTTGYHACIRRAVGGGLTFSIIPDGSSTITKTAQAGFVTAISKIEFLSDNYGGQCENIDVRYMRVFDRELSDAEVQAEAASATALAANLNFSCPANAPANWGNDVSGNARNLTLTGTSVDSSWEPTNTAGAAPADLPPPRRRPMAAELAEEALPRRLRQILPSGPLPPDPPFLFARRTVEDVATVEYAHMRARRRMVLPSGPVVTAPFLFARRSLPAETALVDEPRQRLRLLQWNDLPPLVLWGSFVDDQAPPEQRVQRRRLYLVPDSGVVGTGAVVLDEPTVAGTGTLSLVGAGAVVLDEPTAAGVGTETLAGTGAVVLDEPAVAGAGTETLLGTGAVALDEPTAAGTGSETSAGTGAVVLDEPVVAGTGTETLIGTGAVTADEPVVFGSGDVQGAPITGGGAVTLDEPVVVGVGTIAIIGTGAVVLDEPAVAGAGLYAGFLIGTGAVTADEPSVAAVGTLSLVGAGAVVLDEPVVVGIGLLAISQGAVVLPEPIAAGVGTMTLIGFGAVVLDEPVAFGFVQAPDIIGIGSIVLDEPIAAGEGYVVRVPVFERRDETISVGAYLPPPADRPDWRPDPKLLAQPEVPPENPRILAPEIPGVDPGPSSLVEQYADLVNSARDMYAAYGLLPQRVVSVRVHWSGGEVGRGTPTRVLERELLPRPTVTQRTKRVLTAGGVNEVGTVVLTGINPNLTEDQVLDLFHRSGMGPGDEGFIEIYMDSRDGSAKRRSYVPDGAPERRAGDFDWRMTLVQLETGRDRKGNVSYPGKL